MAEYEANSLAHADIEAVANLANDGDTIILPSGNYQANNWATIDIRNGVRLIGQGQNATIIRMPSTFYNHAFRYNYNYFVCTNPVEIANFRLVGPGCEQSENGSGICYWRAMVSHNFHIHDLRIEEFNQAGIVFYAANYNQPGVVANCYFQNNRDAVPYNYGYGVTIGGYNNQTYPDPKPDLGSANVIFIEDCEFNGCKHGIASGTMAAYVARYNTFRNPYTPHAQCDAHGFYGNAAGTVNWEIYKNTFLNDGNTHWHAIGLRGGSGVVWDNVITGDYLYWATLLMDDTENAEYPDKYVVQGAYFWNNALNGNLVDANVGYVENSYWTQIDRDYFMEQKANYTPYTYPHPSRGVQTLVRLRKAARQ